MKNFRSFNLVVRFCFLMCFVISAQPKGAYAGPSSNRVLSLMRVSPYFSTRLANLEPKIFGLQTQRMHLSTPTQMRIDANISSIKGDSFAQSQSSDEDYSATILQRFLCFENMYNLDLTNRNEFHGSEAFFRNLSLAIDSLKQSNERVLFRAEKSKRIFVEGEYFQPNYYFVSSHTEPAGIDEGIIFIISTSSNTNARLLPEIQSLFPLDFLNEHPQMSMKHAVFPLTTLFLVKRVTKKEGVTEVLMEEIGGNAKNGFDAKAEYGKMAEHLFGLGDHLHFLRDLGTLQPY